MRDLETVQLALTAAETATWFYPLYILLVQLKLLIELLMFSLLDKKDQIRSMLSESLEAVIAQKLMVTKDGNGRVPACEILIANPACKKLN